MKIRKQKGHVTMEILSTIFALGIIVGMLIMNQMVKHGYDKEINEQEALVAKHHESKAGHIVISSYEECIEKNTWSFSTKAAKDAAKDKCIQLTTNNTKLLANAEQMKDGIRHLREYIQENEEFEKRLHLN